MDILLATKCLTKHKINYSRWSELDDLGVSVNGMFDDFLLDITLDLLDVPIDNTKLLSSPNNIKDEDIYCRDFIINIIDDGFESNLPIPDIIQKIILAK